MLLFFILYPAICLGQGEESGSVYAWGRNDFGQCDVPEPNSGFIAISVNQYHNLGLKNDGSVVGWGYNYYNQCDVPEPNSGFIDIAAGNLHSLGLKNNGSIVGWGSNHQGQCNVPEPNSGFIAIATGLSHCLGLRNDGSIVAWGSNDYGQCNVPQPNSDFIKIAASGWNSLGLKEDGSIAAWGRNNFGQCDVPLPNSGFIKIAAGGNHNLGLKADGSIIAWGRNHYGQCDVPQPNSDFIKIAAGGWNSLGLKEDGSIVAWGRNDCGQLNVPLPNSGFIDIAACGNHSLAIKQSSAFTTAFVYKGILAEEGIPLIGIYDFEFNLYDEPEYGTLLALPVTIEDIEVIDGHYTAELDFGSGLFNGEPRWLEIWSRPANSTDDFVTLSPRQKISAVPYALYAYTGGSASGQINGGESQNSLDAADGFPTDAVYVDNDGNVGIGTLSPVEKLQVDGAIRMTGFKLTTNPSNGYVLTSDSSGLGTWRALPITSQGITGSGTTNYLTKFTNSTRLGNSIIFETSGNIGIGTTNPSQKLEVRGGAIKATGGLIIQTVDSQSEENAMTKVTGQIWLRTDL